MNKKGFTIAEMITSLLIISLIGGIGFASFSFISDIVDDNYYRVLRSDLLLAGSDYFDNHRGDFVGAVLEVSIDRLVLEGYIDEVKDHNNNVCHNGKVIKYKGDDKKFHYDVCITCGDYTNYGDYCE